MSWSSCDFRGTHVVTPPRPHESRYRFRLTNKKTGGRATAWLTYELFPALPETRTILLCDEHSLVAGSSYAAGFEILRETLKADRNLRFRRAKTVVVELAEGTRTLPSTRVVVHKFGPVPAFVLDEVIELPLHEGMVAARIGIYPRSPEAKGPAEVPPSFLASSEALRGSMSHAPHRVFLRYLEDIAEEFHDLRRSVTEQNFHRRAKSAETLLSQSIRTKLDRLIPGQPLGTSANTNEREAWKWFQAHADVLYDAAVAYSFAFYLLNRLYPLMGIQPKDYSTRVAQWHSHFNTLLGKQQADHLRQSSEVIEFLEGCSSLLRSEHGGLDESARALLHQASVAPSHWMAEFAKFAAFVAMTHQLRPTAAPVTVFLSRHFQVPASEILAAQIGDWVSQEYKGRVATVSINGLKPGAPFRHFIRCGIWLSRGTLAICPANTTTITGAKDKNYRWIAREAEYTALLRKRLLFASQVGANSGLVLADLGDPSVDYLITSRRLPPPPDRAAAVTREFTGSLHATFQVTNTVPHADHLDPAFKAEMKPFISSLRLRSLRTLLDGYIEQFDPNTQRTLIAVLSRLGPLGNHPIKWVVREVAKAFGLPSEAARRSFNACYRNVRSRRLDIGRAGVSLLELMNRKYYRDRTILVIRLFCPEMSSRERKDWRAQWLTDLAQRNGLEHLTVR